nr:ROK family protein [Stakelama sediminis]
MPLAGVELGGTKCICTLAYGPEAIVDQHSIATTTPDQTLPALRAVLDRWWKENRFAAIGINSFGPVQLHPDSPAYGHIAKTPKPGWSDADIVGSLTGAYPVPFGFDTDVNGAALAEMRWGCAQDIEDFAYITVGTGVGVGLIVNGKPTRGMLHCELGHLRTPRLPEDDAPSACPFHSDCVEGLASGPGIAAALQGYPIDSLNANAPVWDRVVRSITCLCHALATSTGPMRIAIGGGVFTRQPHLLPRVQTALIESLNGYLPLPTGTEYIVSPDLGDQAGPMGGIALALDALAG